MKTTLQRFTDGQRVLVRQDEDKNAINRVGTVTRICSDGERAWVQLDGKGGNPGNDDFRARTGDGDKVRCYPEDCEPATRPQHASRKQRRAASAAAAQPAPALALFGKDHWSTFAYIETRIVDHRGEPNREQMRCHVGRHPLLVGQRNGNGAGYPTILKGGVELRDHDDWDCLDDLIREGFLVNGGSAVNPVYALTPRGREVASQLRDHKGRGGNFAEFTPHGAVKEPQAAEERVR